MDLMAKAKEVEQLHFEPCGSISANLPKSAKIFIVDDDGSAREAMEKLIRALGYETETFMSAEDCLGRGCIAQASCLITDVQMPGMSGFELNRRLHVDGYRIPVIFVSGHAGETFLDAAFQVGAIGFLGKPVNTHRLIECLDKALKASLSG